MEKTKLTEQEILSKFEERIGADFDNDINLIDEADEVMEYSWEE